MSDPSRPRPDEVGGQPAEYIDTPHDQPGDQHPPRDVAEGAEADDTRGEPDEERLGAEGSDTP